MAKPQRFEVDLPAGGTLVLLSDAEVALFEQSKQNLQRDYQITAQNDLVLVGALLTQHVIAYRAQQRLSGMEPEVDPQGRPTGNYVAVSIKQSDQNAAQKALTDATEEMRKLEKALGVSKADRDAGGQYTVANYVSTLKLAARSYGVHISKRLKAYEEFTNELRWRLRLLKNGDEEDKAYHNLSPEKVLDWAGEQLAALEEIDKTYARERGSIFIGQLR